MIVVGLTGSIAMGKTTVAQMFAALGWPVFSADEAVHSFYGSYGARVVDAAFPGVAREGLIDRALLAARVLGNEEAMAKLESIVHPVVAECRKSFLSNAAAARRRGVILDIPLLFETAGESSVDIVVVVSASAEKQRARALSRPGMSSDKLLSIVTRQLGDAEKRRKAHYIVDTNNSLEQSRRQVEDFTRAIIALPGAVSKVESNA
jgi:dephospho-CoA kinase